MIIIKTLIELFDECPIENVISALSFKPEKIVFVGFIDTMKKRRKKDIKRFFEMKKLDIEIEYEIVGRYDFDELADKLNFVIDRNEDCCFDLTGGKEMVLAAMGVVSQQRDIPMIQFDIKNDKFVRVKNCEEIGLPGKRSVLISESVALNGGATVESGRELWSFTEEFRNDVLTAWEICKENCGLWNRQTSVFASFEGFGAVNGTFVTVDLSRAKAHNYDTMIDKNIIDKLAGAGLIKEFKLDKDIVSFRYKNEQVRHLISKAGNILELYTYITAIQINDISDGYYSDIDIGVKVDWDGIIYDDKVYDATETRNEIDIMMTRGVVPIFISCKNGEVKKEALYELDSMARKFGGEYAKKILLSTYVHTNSDTHKHILQRAEDMGISVIEKIHTMSHEKFLSELKQKTN